MSMTNRPSRRSGLAECCALVGGILGIAILAAPASAERGLDPAIAGLFLPLPASVAEATPRDPGLTEPDATGALIEPPIGERPTPAEAREADLEDRILMRPPGGDAAGGRPDIPVER